MPASGEGSTVHDSSRRTSDRRPASPSIVIEKAAPPIERISPSSNRSSENGAMNASSASSAATNRRSPEDGSDAMTTPPLADAPRHAQLSSDKGLSLESNGFLNGATETEPIEAARGELQSQDASDEAYARQLEAELNARRPRTVRRPPSVSYAETAADNEEQYDSIKDDFMEGPSSRPAPGPSPIAAIPSSRSVPASPRATARSLSRRVPRHHDEDTSMPDASAVLNVPRSQSAARATSSSKRKSGAASTFTPVLFAQDGVNWERQSQRCHVRRYLNYPKCGACISKMPYELCDFADIRILPHILTEGAAREELELQKTEDGKATLARLASEPFSSVHFDYPPRDGLFPAMDDVSLQRIKATTASALLEHMQAERQHAKKAETLWRRTEAAERFRCANCYTSIFSASYICRVCGKEYCPECADDMQHGHAPESGETQSSQPGGSALSAKLPKLIRCVYGNTHSAAELCPITRLTVEELEDEVARMEEVIAAAAEKGKAAGGTAVAEDDDDGSLWGGDASAPEKSRDYVLDTSLTGPQVDERVGSHILTEFDNDVDEATFRREWAKGDPVVVHNCLDPERMSALGQPSAWGPDNFTTASYQGEPCIVERCDNSRLQQIYVSKFFETLGKNQETKRAAVGGEAGTWKLKDWPPQSGFDHTFPQLYAHFNAALPVPNYTRRDGSMNISALYARNGVSPDLGPKMYTAWPSTEDQAGKGSTRLHMDVADAVNIMYYSATPPDVDPATLHPSHRDGVAAWDIFPAKDANALRQYLIQHRGLSLLDAGDPIHSQLHYLDGTDRQRLWAEHGVRSWRIYQKKGDAVFIPAGCAHQVCNLADCMKVAVDFVSPENVARCFQLTSEFRDVNRGHKAWKEDTLQLKKMLWHAWRACRTMEGHDYEAAAKAIGASAAKIKLDRHQPIRERISSKRAAEETRPSAAKSKKNVKKKKGDAAILSSNVGSFNGGTEDEGLESNEASRSVSPRKSARNPRRSAANNINYAVTGFIDAEEAEDDSYDDNGAGGRRGKASRPQSKKSSRASEVSASRRVRRSTPGAATTFRPAARATSSAAAATSSNKRPRSRSAGSNGTAERDPHQPRSRRRVVVSDEEEDSDLTSAAESWSETELAAHSSRRPPISRSRRHAANKGLYRRRASRGEEHGDDHESAQPPLISRAPLDAKELVDLLASPQDVTSMFTGMVAPPRSPSNLDTASGRRQEAEQRRVRAIAARWTAAQRDAMGALHDLWAGWDVQEEVTALRSSMTEDRAAAAAAEVGGAEDGEGEEYGPKTRREMELEAELLAVRKRAEEREAALEWEIGVASDALRAIEQHRARTR
ncbi:hypothetical protein BDZ90DRAFT_224999 [Jaminaea rosea]|uniref:JmjC domain-containing protein n=1 Tax=Jaminaea rosea TaxID=1569628 RepID=A0A316UXT1_9BASI|nr:hypothetical protein BDZ90DRAFT_224999 [Jaminaea rosea]PWN30022.1 hypothetical protein BDZ90DRAFT_224999 [Jaminaea rosea]